MDNTCYWVPNITKTWNEAITFCQSYGGKLAEPINLDQNEKIAALVQKIFDGERFFIGISDQAEESKYFNNLHCKHM